MSVSLIYLYQSIAQAQRQFWWAQYNGVLDALEVNGGEGKNAEAAKNFSINALKSEKHLAVWDGDI